MLRPRKGKWLFWKYDIYPYILGAEILNFRIHKTYTTIGNELLGIHEQVYLKGYGWYSVDESYEKTFIICLPPSKANKLQKHLDALKISRERKLTEIKEEWQDLLDGVLEFYGIKNE